MKTEADSSPYIGLRPFTKSDRRYFFGRERDQRVIFSSLSASPLTVLYGPSGTGKSSVLHAGLIPMVRLHSRRTGIVYFSSWRDAAFLDELKRKCIAEAKHVARKKNFTVDAALPLPELIAELQRHLSRPILVVLDQFEEYLLSYPESGNDRPFESELAGAIALGESGASFLIALREDSLSRLDRFRMRIPNLLGNTLRLEALNAAGAEEAIRDPLRVYRERHPDTRAPTEIEDALVTKVLDQICFVQVTQLVEAAEKDGPVAPARRDKIEAAILQLVMKTLWEEERNSGSPILRLVTLDRLGSAARIVETYFACVMERFSSNESEICAAIFRFLVTPSGGKVAYNTSDLVHIARRPPADVNPVLKKLVEFSVLRKIDAPERYEILHDILAPAVIGWRHRHVERQRLAREAVERETLLAAERKSRLLRGAIVVALVFLGLAVFAITQWVRARNAAEQTKRGLAQLVAGKFEEAAVKNQSVPGKDLLFLLRARDILKATFRGTRLDEQLALVDERLAEAIHSWKLPPAQIYVFTHPRHPTGDFLTVDGRSLIRWDTDKRQKGTELVLGMNRPAAAEESDAETTTEQPIVADTARESVQAVSRDGRRAILSTAKGTMIWELVQDEKISVPTGTRVVAFSDVDERVLVERSGILEIWDKGHPTKGRPLRGNFNPAGLLFRANTTQVVAMEGDVLKVQDVKSRTVSIREFRSERGKIVLFALSPDGNQLAFAESDGAIRLAKLDDAKKTEPRILSATVQEWKTLAFDRESQRLAGFAGGQVHLWNVKNGEAQKPIAIGAATQAVFSHDLQWIATSSSSGVTLHALTSASKNIVAAAQKRASGQLEFEDIVNTYDELTKDFRLGVEAARKRLDEAEAARHFRDALAVFREVDPALRFDPTVEARRLTAEGFLSQAEADAREGEYNKAKDNYAKALKLNSKVDPQLPERLRRWALEALLRRADVAAAKGDLDAALKDFREAVALGAKVDPGAEKRLVDNVAEARVNEARLKLDAGERETALRLFEQALKLNPALAASLNPQREIEKAQARELMRKAWDDLKAGRLLEAIRQFGQARKLAGATAEHEFAESSALARAGYDTLTGALEIEFRSGATYRYAAVPAELYDALLRAGSKGRYFSEQIRGKYASERLQRGPLAPVSLSDGVTIGGFARELLKAANNSVTQAPTDIRLRQLRGVARALAGDLVGAADDLFAFASNSDFANSAFGRQNKEWAEQLRAGKNPFTSEVLEKFPGPSDR